MTTSNTKVLVQRVWNWISVPSIAILMWHVFSAGPLQLPLGVIDKAVADQSVVIEPELSNVDVLPINDVKSAEASLQEPKLKALNEVDAMHLAVSLGRLDFVSLGLTVLGVVLAVLGLLGFWKIERDTKLVAEEVSEREAKKTSRSEAQRLAKVYLNSEEFKNNIEQRINTEVRDIAPEIIERWLREKQKYTTSTPSDHSDYIPTDDDNAEKPKEAKNDV